MHPRQPFLLDPLSKQIHDEGCQTRRARKHEPGKRYRFILWTARRVVSVFREQGAAICIYTLRQAADDGSRDGLVEIRGF